MASKASKPHTRIGRRAGRRESKGLSATERPAAGRGQSEAPRP